MATRSARALQVVFLVCGALAVVTSVPGVPGLATLSWHEVVQLRSSFWDFRAEGQYSTIAYLVLGTGFVIGGLCMEEIVSTRARWLRWLIIVAGLAVVGELVLHHAVSHHLVGFLAPQADLMGTIASPASLRVEGITRWVWAGIRIAVLMSLYVCVRRVCARWLIVTAIRSSIVLI